MKFAAKIDKNFRITSVHNEKTIFSSIFLTKLHFFFASSNEIWVFLINKCYFCTHFINYDK